MPTNLIIKSHHPWRHRAKILLLLCLLGAAAWLLVDYGDYRTEAAGLALLEERDELRLALENEQKNNHQLSERIAILQRAGQVDQQAYGEVERTLKQVQDEMLELNEELAFYRGILMPTENSAGLNIADFSVAGIGEERAYRFKLVLTQVKANERLVEGYARVRFEGVQNGAQVQLDLKELTGGTLDKFRLRFKYFQHHEGEIVLPTGFLPSRVLVEVVPSSRGLRRLKKTFDWSDIIK